MTCEEELQGWISRMACYIIGTCVAKNSWLHARSFTVIGTAGPGSAAAGTSRQQFQSPTKSMEPTHRRIRVPGLRVGTHGFGLAESELSLVARHAGLSFPPWVLSECLKQLCNDIKSSILCKMRMLHGKPASGVAGVLLGATTSVTAASLRRQRQRRHSSARRATSAAAARRPLAAATQRPASWHVLAE